MPVKQYGSKFPSWDHIKSWNIMDIWPCFIIWEKEEQLEKKIKINRNRLKEKIEVRDEKELRWTCQSLKRRGWYRITRNWKEEQNVNCLLKGLELNIKIYWIIILQYKAKVMTHLEGANVG